MTTTLTLPALVAGRDLADAFVNSLGDIAGQDIVVDARQLESGTSSFASQLIRRILVDADAPELVVVGAPGQFVRYVRDAAITVGVSARLRTVESMDLAVAS